MGGGPPCGGPELSVFAGLSAPVLPALPSLGGLGSLTVLGLLLA